MAEGEILSNSQASLQGGNEYGPGVHLHTNEHAITIQVDCAPPEAVIPNE